MMKRVFFKSLQILLCVGGVVYCEYLFPRLAVFVNPVCDLFFEQLSTKYYHDARWYHLYKYQPCMAVAPHVCHRVFQGFAHDIVDVVDYNDHEAGIVSGRIDFDNPVHNPNNVLWTLRENIVFLDDLQKDGVNCQLFPEQISCNSSFVNEHAVVLIKPWHSPVHKKYYSVGTRFTVKECDQEFCHVYIFDPLKKAFFEDSIPRDAVRQNTSSDQKMLRKSFVGLAQKWARIKGNIPYVWGGASATHHGAQGAITKGLCDILPNTIIWKRISSYALHEKPLCGFDCSRLVLMAAQCAGIPYRWGNTVVLKRNLKEIEYTSQSPKEGDLLWYPGHVMIISDVKKNLLVEASGYQSGHGKVHEISLHKKFKNITTYKDLIHAIVHKKPLSLLHKDGSVYDTIKDIKILSLF